MIPKPAPVVPRSITLEEAEQLVDNSIKKNGGTSALVDFFTIAPDVLAKLKALYEDGRWTVNIVPMRDGGTIRFQLS